MLRWRVVFASVLAAVVVLAVAPGAAAAPAPGISITGAEMALGLGTTEFINVTGTGVCGAVGNVVITVTVTDVETGAIASNIGDTQCQAVSEHISWVATPVSFGLNDFRPGDRVDVSASATGAITDTDAKRTTLKQYH
jgi:hypothetical protein